MAFNAGAVTAKFQADINDFVSKIQKAQNNLKTFGDKVQKATSGQVKNLQAFGKGLTKHVNGVLVKTAEIAKTAGLAIGAGLIAVGTLALKTAGDFETMRVSLKTAFQGNVEAAKAAEKQIKSFAARTPFQLQEVTNGFIKLRNMGLNPSEKALQSYGDTASAMGKSLDQMVEAVADAATGEFERLKEFGIRASSEKDKVTFTFRGVSKTVKKNSKEIEDYLIGLGNTYFAGGMAEQSQTLNGLFSTLKDTVLNTLDTIAQESGLLDFGKNAIVQIMDVISRNEDKITNFVIQIGKTAQIFGTLIKQYLPVLIALWDQFSKGFLDSYNLFIKPAFASLQEEFTKLKKIYQDNKTEIDLIVKGFLYLLGWVTGTFVGGMIKAISIVVNIIGQIANKIGSVTRTVQTGFSSIKGWMVNPIEKAKDRIIETIDKIIEKFKEVKKFTSDLAKTGVETAFNPGKSIIKGTKSLFGKRATGGPVMAGKLYEVGENGAELFRAGGKNYMIPGQNGQVYNQQQISNRNVTINQYGNNLSTNFIPSYGF